MCIRSWDDDSSSQNREWFSTNATREVEKEHTLHPHDHDETAQDPLTPTACAESHVAIHEMPKIAIGISSLGKVKCNAKVNKMLVYGNTMISFSSLFFQRITDHLEKDCLDDFAVVISGTWFLALFIVIFNELLHSSDNYWGIDSLAPRFIYRFFFAVRLKQSYFSCSKQPIRLRWIFSGIKAPILKLS